MRLEDALDLIDGLGLVKVGLDSSFRLDFRDMIDDLGL